MTTAETLAAHDRAEDVGTAASTCAVAWTGCTHHLGGEVDGLLCILEAGHTPGCSFIGSSVSDDHDASEAAAERRNS